MMVLDASAVLALLQDEAGADEVEEAIDSGAVISAVNLAEVLGKMVDAGATPDAAAGLVLGLFAEVEVFGLQAARDTAAIRAVAPDRSLSMGDRACLSLARLRSLPVVTADRAWRQVAGPLEVDVRVVR
jgi:ribonuclease VapC